MYEDYGIKCLDFFNGIFGLALWDENKKELYLARDRAGVKPLYYYFDGKNFIFSSEIKAILNHNIPRQVEERALVMYFKLFYVPAPLTLFKNILKLKPAHFIIYKNNKLRVERYWDIEDSDIKYSKEEAIDGIKTLMRDSVKRQLISDRPVGIFLSGGIDSTAVLGNASEFSPGIKTYSIGFSDKMGDEKFDNKFNRDFYLARSTSKLYNTDHHELTVSGEDIRLNFEKTVWHMDEPNPNPTHVPTFLLAKEAKRDVAVVLGGDGGDEIFGGYPRYYYSALLDRYQVLPEFLRKNILPVFFEKFLKKKNAAYKFNVPKTIDRYLLFMSEHDDTLREMLNTRVLGETNTDLLFKEYFPQNKFKDFSNYLMYLDLTMWLADESLMRTDKMTMAHGLEERVPILDHRLIEFAFRIPTKFKIRGAGNNNKWIFRQAMSQYLPRDIMNKDKRGWFSPGSLWLRRELKDFAYEVLSPSYCADTQEYFDFIGIAGMLDDHMSAKRYNLFSIWSLLTFQVWYRKFIAS